jgi:predicted nucleic acid-binding protein
VNHTERFVDSGYLIALVNVQDDLHRRARELARSLRGPLVTTEVVLIEVGDSLSRHALRQLAVQVINEFRASPTVEIVRTSTEPWHCTRLGRIRSGG